MSLPIEITELSKVYAGKKRTKVQALTDLSLTVESGEVFGFVGPNGAGKSTTIKILMGLIRPSSGGARLGGVPVHLTEARRRVGYLPENPSFYDFLTAREYLSFVGDAFSMSAAQKKTRTGEVLDLLDLHRAADRQIRSYSKGMVQRLGLAQALLHDPDVYVLDEPMSGLDPLGRSLVKEIIKDLKARGKTVFFITHITADVEAVCDRVGVIVNGRLEALDRVADILREGVIGYMVQVRGVRGEALPEFRHVGGDLLAEYEVPKERFAAFISAVTMSGGTVEFIDTRRRDIEDFFLDIVEQHG